MPFQVCYRVRATRRNSPTEGEYVEMCERVWTINEMQVVKRWNIVAIRSQIIHRVMQNFYKSNREWRPCKLHTPSSQASCDCYFDYHRQQESSGEVLNVAIALVATQSFVTSWLWLLLSLSQATFLKNCLTFRMYSLRESWPPQGELS